ncbi:type VII secretion target [Actinoplanes sp. NPDC049118]|uniref:type VII secretion target n=1 Tax=Actinoplanes sp. NPDC049118 TaxID=3155769 RepID=UPI0033CF4B80
MTDYPWHSQASIEVATDGIRAEAKKWYGFSDTMESITQAMAGMTLQPTAFAVIDASAAMTMADQHGAYSTTQTWLTELFRDASTKFNEMGDALKKNADEYDRTDGESADSFDKIANS